MSLKLKEDILSDKLRRSSLRSTGYKRWSYIHEGQLCIESGILCITAKCYAYLLWSGVNYTNSESLESKGVSLRVSQAKLCNRLREWLLYCAAWELCMGISLPNRDRGWLRLGLRHFMKQLSCEPRDDCMWCVIWGIHTIMHMIRFLGNKGLSGHLSWCLLGV
jgi:hypothetical protein